MPEQTWRNEVLHSWAMTAVLWGAMIALFGRGVIPFLLIQATYGASLLEVVKYPEHHGLGRKLLRGGRYVRVMNPHVVAHYRGNMAQSNIRPAIRERVLAQFAGAHE